MNAPDQRWPDPSPMRRDPEPAEQQIRWYAEKIRLCLLRSKQDAGELLAMATGAPLWDDFAVAVVFGTANAHVLGFELIRQEAQQEAERIASDMLYGDKDHSDTLKRIGAPSVDGFWDWYNRQYA